MKKTITIPYSVIRENDIPLFTIKAILKENGFNLNAPIESQDNFFNAQIIYTQDVNNE